MDGLSERASGGGGRGGRVSVCPGSDLHVALFVVVVVAVVELAGSLGSGGHRARGGGMRGDVRTQLGPLDISQLTAMNL